MVGAALVLTLLGGCGGSDPAAEQPSESASPASSTVAGPPLNKDKATKGVKEQFEKKGMKPDSLTCQEGTSPKPGQPVPCTVSVGGLDIKGKAVSKPDGSVEFQFDDISGS